jgi:hypothetical protein
LQTTNKTRGRSKTDQGIGEIITPIPPENIGLRKQKNLPGKKALTVTAIKKLNNLTTIKKEPGT